MPFEFNLSNPVGSPLNDALGGNLQGVTDLFGTMKKDAEQKPLEITAKTNADTGVPEISVNNLTPQILQKIMGAMEFQTKATSAMQQRADFLQQQEQRARQNPLLNVLSTVAGNLAVADKRLPPLVQALGRSSLMLNPTPDALAHERMGLNEQIGRTSALGGQLAINALGEERKAQHEQAALIQNQRTENIRLFADLGKAAQRGELTDATVTAKTLESIGVAPDVAKAQAEQLVGVSQQKQKIDAALAVAKDAREQALLQERGRESDQRIAAMIGAAQLHSDTQIKLAQMKQETDEKKMSAKSDADRMKIPPAIPQKMADLRSAESALDEVEAGLKKYSKYQGIFAGRVIEPIAAYTKRDVGEFFTKMKLQVAQAIKSTGAGARGFGPMERGFFEQLAESKTHSATWNLGIIDAWRDYLRQNRGAYVDAYEGLRDEKYRNLLGKDAEKILESAAPAGKGSGDPLGVR